MSDLNKAKVEDLDYGSDIIIDARSEKEYALDHVPNAINLPILDNEERHIVGFIYKQVNQKDAFDKGYLFFEKKKKEILRKISKYKNKRIFVYCARGGMRSKAMTEFLSQNGFKATQIEGGYKCYRENVRNELNTIKLPKIFVVYGLTGSGKTRLLKNVENFVDLEGLAKHRSSLFGMVGLKPVSQKMFETQLLFELKNKKNYIIFEGESKKIGDVFIPQNIYSQIQKGTNIRLETSTPIRVKKIVDEYFCKKENIEEIRNIIPKLRQKLGSKKIEEMLLWMDEKRFDLVSKTLLLDYYDPLYRHTIENKEYGLIVDGDDEKKAIKKITEFCQKNH